MLKTIIYYHRAYRKIAASRGTLAREFLTIALPLSLLMFVAYPVITRWMSLFTQAVLEKYYPPGSIEIIRQPFFLGDVSFVGIPGTNPSLPATVVNLAVSLALTVLLPRVRKGKNAAIYLFYLAAINLASSLFFLFFHSDFPYSATRFSELYVITEISMWIFIPFILGMAIVLFPPAILPKATMIAATLVYSIVIGALRYILFLFIVTKFSVLYMALLYFAFGPLVDFIYIVGIFSFYSNRLAVNLRGSIKAWKWLY
ncbi:MAG: hypothetical protein JW793_07130 [Acidobacteria bacterium]|nr:hypothetical protein [Acidobacteriota bacterium]